MPETITVDFPDIMGDVSTYTAFLRAEVGGGLLNAGGDVITEISGTGIFSLTLTETRVANAFYLVRIYLGASQTSSTLVFSDKLWPGQTMVGKEPSAPVMFGTVGATSPSTTSFTPSVVSVSGDVANKWVGRIILFDDNTTTVGLRGQGTDITAVSAAALPLLTYTALTTAPVSGDTYKIV